MARGAAVVGLLAWLAVAGSATADTPTSDEPFERARARGRPVVVWVTAPDCAACRTFEQEVLADRRVVSALDRTVFVTVELGDAAAESLTERLDLGVAPALVAFDRTGSELDRRQGADVPARVREMLEFVDMTLGSAMDWDAVRRELGPPEPPPPAARTVRVPLEALDEASDRAKRFRSIVLIEFTAQWCEPCHVFEETILADPGVKRALEEVQVVTYDVDTPEGRRAHELYGGGERRIPAFVLLDPWGTVLDRTIASRVFSPKRFVEFVSRGWVRQAAHVERVGRPAPVYVADSAQRLRRELLVFGGYGAGLANHVLVGVRAMIPLSDATDDLRLAAFFHGEGGVTTDGEPVVDVDLMGGFATGVGPARIGLFAGTGVSQVGDAAVASFQVPVELSFDYAGDAIRAAAWARTTWLAEAERKHGSDNAPIGTDEILLGVGVRLPARAPHGVWVGLSYRQLMGEQMLSFTFGTGSAR